MKPTLFIGAAALAIGTYSIPMQAHAAFPPRLTPILPIEATADDDNGSYEVARRGRSGTGCDDPGDFLEHAECRQ